MIKLGVTGGIGSGKSIVCAILADMGYPVYDSDKRAKAVMVSNFDVVSALKRLFGDNAYCSDGSLNRAYISSIVFSDADKLKQLNAIVHPAVTNDFLLWCENCEDEGAEIVVCESAILEQTPLINYIDKTIVVQAPVSLRVRRAAMRDNISEEEVKKRVEAQHNTINFDFIVINDEEKLLLPQVIEIINFLVGKN